MHIHVTHATKFPESTNAAADGGAIYKQLPVLTARIERETLPKMWNVHAKATDLPQREATIKCVTSVRGQYFSPLVRCLN